jgi:hypothetical protein
MQSEGANREVAADVAPRIAHPDWRRRGLQREESAALTIAMPCFLQHNANMGRLNWTTLNPVGGACGSPLNHADAGKPPCAEFFNHAGLRLFPSRAIENLRRFQIPERVTTEGRATYGCQHFT